MKSNFEEDIKVLRLKLRDSDDYARAFYCALCNMQWKKLGSDNLYSCTWRYAGGLVARLRNKGEDYLHFYCSGNEGTVRADVEEDLNALEYIPVPWEED